MLLASPETKFEPALPCQLVVLILNITMEKHWPTVTAAINNIQKHLTITAQDWKDTQRYCTYLSKSHLFGQLRD